MRSTETTQPKALVIEDDDDLAKLIAIEIRELGYQADTASDGIRGLELAQTNTYRFIILDLMLPGLEGVEVCKRLQQGEHSVPIIVVTARSDDLSKVLLLELGADDYLTKPFNPMELRARIKAVLRRAHSTMPTEEILSIGGLEIDFARRKVSRDGQPIELTPREYDLLFLLASQPGYPMSREELNEHIYGASISGYEKSVTSHINRLRQKIEADPQQPRLLKTVRGHGYCFTDREDK